MSRLMIKTVHSIFDGSCPDVHHEPTGDISPEKSVVGMIENPVAKRFWSFAKDCSVAIDRMGEEHQRAHNSGTCNEFSCKKFAEKLLRANTERNVFRGFFWEFVYAQFPEVRNIDSISVNKDWFISVSRDDFVQWDKPLFDSRHPSSRFLEFVQGILGGTSLFDFPIELQPIGDEEKMLGKLEDELVKQILTLRVGLRNPDWVRLPNMPDAQVFMDWVKSKTVAEAIEFQLQILRLSEQSNLLDEWFWLAVKDLIPAAQKPLTVGLRKDWWVVEVPSTTGNPIIDEFLQ
ncbi:MAG TPA: hypothetical protein PKE08_00260 [Candidatus Paceibacterota bacterium]|nr:hypothetical protein [Candidatus Paceibacterota bacterium]